MKRMTFLLCMLAINVAAHGQLKIVTTTTDYADLARQVGGDRADVHSVMRGPEDVHNVLAKPTEMVKLNRADLFVHGGLDAEPWRDNLLRGGRNPRVNPGRPGNVDMSAGIELKDVPAGRVDRSMGDVHAYGNTHYSLSPANAQRMTATLAKAMAQADPANADAYKRNAARLVNELADVSREIRARFAPWAGLKVVTFHHGAWDYFSDAVPIRIVGEIEPKPSITPSPEQLRQLVARMKEEQVKVVICGTYNDDRLARHVAEQAGATLVVLPEHVLGVAEANSYQSLFRHNVEKLIEAAKSAGVQPVDNNAPAPAAAAAATTAGHGHAH